MERFNCTLILYFACIMAYLYVKFTQPGLALIGDRYRLMKIIIQDALCLSSDEIFHRPVLNASEECECLLMTNSQQLSTQNMRKYSSN